MQRAVELGIARGDVDAAVCRRPVHVGGMIHRPVVDAAHDHVARYEVDGGGVGSRDAYREIFLPRVGFGEELVESHDLALYRAERRVVAETVVGVGVGHGDYAALSRHGLHVEYVGRLQHVVAGRVVFGLYELLALQLAARVVVDAYPEVVDRALVLLGQGSGSWVHFGQRPAQPDVRRLSRFIGR